MIKTKIEHCDYIVLNERVAALIERIISGVCGLRILHGENGGSRNA